MSLCAMAVHLAVCQSVPDPSPSRRGSLNESPHARSGEVGKIKATDLK
jgi:hypothetical protein